MTANPSIEFMALTPVKSKMSPSRRKIAPSTELLSPTKRIAILKAGSLTSSQSVKPASHVLLSPSCPLLPEEVQVAKAEAASVTDCSHIILDFDLHIDRDLFFDEGTVSTLVSLFPGVQTVSWDDFFLTFRFDQLPPKPWPKTIAGVPIYFTVQDGDFGPLDKVIQNRVRTRISILEEVDARGKTVGNNVEVFDQHVEDIFKYFKKTNIKITQIQNWNDFVVIVLKDKDQNTENLPNHIMQMPCYILFNEDITSNRQPALLLKEPTLTDPPVSDDTEYQVLRSGVMITCGPLSNGQSLTTTSGVLVQDSFGDKYVTVASHGFPNLGPVHHPKSDGRIIGNISIDYSLRYNIALMKLKENETFVNKTFDSAEGSGSRLASLAPTRRTRKGDMVSMNNPFMGMCDGQVGAVVYDPYELFEGDPKQFRVHAGIWTWTGKDSSQVMADGICGSAVWNERDEVVGFFRFVGIGALDGFCYCTGAENLLREGYKICQEYD